MNSLLQKFFPTTIDHTTSASNPGNLQINYWRYFRSFPAETHQWFAYLYWWLFFVLTINLGYWLAGHWAIINVAEHYSATYPDLLIIVQVLYWLCGIGLNVAFSAGLFKVVQILGIWLIHLREHFSGGCVNPAIVVSQSPPLVAVSTDLRKWDEPYPVIKILEQPLHKLPGGIPPVGTRLATVALYCAGEEQLPHWIDFNPIVVNCVTDSQADIDRVFRSISLRDWQDLQDGLRCVEKRTQLGLYFVNSAERYVQPEGAEQEEDFVPIEQLEFLDIRDVLRVDYQTGTFLRLCWGFPSAKVFWVYKSMKLQQWFNRINPTVGLSIISAIVTILTKLPKVILDSFARQNQADPSAWWVIALPIGLSCVVAPVVFGAVYLLNTPFAQAWEFDRICGTLTVTRRSIFPRSRSEVYPLGQFQNINILDENKDNSIVAYSLVLKQVPRRGFLWFKPKVKHLLLAKIANSEHPELDQRFEVARQVRFTVRRFMDWLII